MNLRLRDRLARLGDWLDDLQTAKAMAGLGVHAFGPPCARCGKPYITCMLPSHRAYSDRRSRRHHGRPLAGLPGVCHCAAEQATCPSCGTPTGTPHRLTCPLEDAR